MDIEVDQSAQDYDNVTTEITGWGQTDQEIPNVSAVLKEANLSTMANSECSEVLKENFGDNRAITDNMICAGVEADQPSQVEGPCSGDSGGPLITRKENTGRYHQIGIVSFVLGAQLRNGRGLPCLFRVFSRVTAQLDWIKKMIKKDNK